MKLNPQVYRDAAELLFNESYIDSASTGCCWAIDEASQYQDVYIKKFREIFKPRSNSIWWFGCEFNEEEQIHRVNALLFMAHITEDENNGIR